MRFFTTVHIMLLLYVIAALVFWGISLNKQSKIIYAQEYSILRSEVDSMASPQEFKERSTAIEEKLESRKKQYIGEGSTFFIVILIGAAVVYTSFRRRLRLSRQQNNFMLSVTHELKSPIAAMKLNLQTLDKHKLDEEKKELLIGRCITESNRLNDLCNNMLLASQIEGGQHRTAKETLDFSHLIMDSFEEFAHRYNRSFTEDIESGIKIHGDRLLLQMAVNNLLENAVKYTPADKTISIRLYRKGAKAHLEVIDEGVGIREEEKGKVFNKFYRIGNEETRQTKGTGLGLYITSKIVKQHHGRITIKDNKPTGAIFEICIPAK